MSFLTHELTQVTSRVLCQEKRGTDSLLFVLIRKDGI